MPTFPKWPRQDIYEDETYDKTMEEVDIIMPFHRADNFLMQAIDSALKSENVIANLILVTDSKQELPQWLAKKANQKNITVLATQTGGYLDALNRGITNSRSKFVAFLDSDDLTDSKRIVSQIDYLSKNDLEVCSSQIIRINNSNKIINNTGLLGTKFENLNPRVKLLFGPLGADSTLVSRGDFIRSNWNLHSTFPQQFADYGWLLSSNTEANYGYCHEGKYYYRSHDSQMSRKKFRTEDWEKIFPLWVNQLNSLDQELPDSSRLEVSSNVAAALALPSSLIKLDKLEVKQLVQFKDRFCSDLEDSKLRATSEIKRALAFRIILASRGKSPLTLRYLPTLMARFVSMIMLGITPRKN